MPKRYILSLQTLIQFSLPSQYTLQIKQLNDISLSQPQDCHVQSWLCLNYSKSSCDLIKNLIENQPADSEGYQDDVDLEEDRRLDYEAKEDLFKGSIHQGPGRTKQKCSITATEWITVLRDRAFKRKLRHLLSKPPSISEEEAARVGDVWDLPLWKRKELYRYWVRKYRTNLKQEITGYEKEYQNEVKNYKEMGELENLDILRSAIVVGMTTTGAEKNRALLRKVGPKVIIV